MELEQIRVITEIASYMVVILSVPFALVKFLQYKKKEQEASEFHAYHVANEKYFNYLDLCISNLDLDIFKYSDEYLESRGMLHSKKELIAFCNIVSMFERAHLMYADTHDEHRKIQWYGWDGMITFYCSKKNFKKAWGIIGRDWDRNFLDYMNKKFKDIGDDQSEAPGS